MKGLELYDGGAYLVGGKIAEKGPKASDEAREGTMAYKIISLSIWSI